MRGKGLPEQIINPILLLSNEIFSGVKTGRLYFKIFNCIYMVREEGFYWVKIYGELLPAVWVIANYFAKHNYWYLCGNDTCFSDRSFTEINETRILPPEN